MSDRNELAESIATHLDETWGMRDFGPAHQDYELAEALIVAGWTKPRTVTTVEELDALPVGSMVLDSDPDALLKTHNGAWRSLCAEEPYGGRYLSLPATVLFAPEPQP
jgi:hypothetical protein